MSVGYEFTVFAEAQTELTVDKLEGLTARLASLVDGDLTNAVVGPVVVRQAVVFDGTEPESEVNLSDQTDSQ